MTVVITSWRPGSTSYLSGQRICDSTGRMDSWSCATIDSNPFVSCSWFGGAAAYITEGCYNGLTVGEKAACVGRYQGIVTSSGYYYVYDTAYYNHYRLNVDSIVKCWSTACSDLRCKDVVCEDMCEGYDLYDSHCEDGVCIKGILIEANNRDICDYDPCRDVVCDDKCYGMDKYNEICEEGVCFPDRLLEPNSEDCDYIPPTPDPDPSDKTNMILVLSVIAVIFIMIFRSIK